MNTEESTHTFQNIVVKENSAIPRFWFCFFFVLNTLVGFMIIIAFYFFYCALKIP